MLFILLSVMCIILTIVLFKPKSDYWKKQNVVQVKVSFFELFLGKRAVPEIYKDIYDKHPDCANVGMILGSRPALLLRDLENIHSVFASDFQSFYSRGIITNPNDTLADNVLFIDDYGRWKVIRQKLSPVFTSMKLKNMFYIMERCARDFVRMIEEDISVVEKPFKALYTYTTATIGASIIGIDTKTQNTMESPFIDMAWKTLTPSFKMNLSFIIGSISPKLFKWFDVRAFGEHEEFFVGVIKKVMERRRQEKDTRHDFIDMCLELQEQGVMKDLATGYELIPTDEILAAQAFFFFIAGTDTSAGTMHFTLIELANHPEILKKVHKEIDEVFSKCNENVSYNEMDKLQYLDMVVNEAMRKYPPVGTIQRRCTKDTVLPKSNIRIAKDDVVVIPVYGVHRDERYYPQPEKFDPDRFSPQNIASIPKFGFLPFGDGNRMCLGMRYARLQVKVGLAWLLRRFTLKAQTETTIQFEKSVFGLRCPDVVYEFLPRNV